MKSTANYSSMLKLSKTAEIRGTNDVPGLVLLVSLLNHVLNCVHCGLCDTTLHRHMASGGLGGHSSTGGTFVCGDREAAATRGLISGGILMGAFKIPQKIRIILEETN